MEAFENGGLSFWYVSKTELSENVDVASNYAVTGSFGGANETCVQYSRKVRIFFGIRF